MKRIFSSFIAGLPITFLLFLFMSSLIESKANPPIENPYKPPNLGQISYRDPLETIVRPELPQNEPHVKQPQTTQTPNEPDDTKIPRIIDDGPTDFSTLDRGDALEVDVSDSSPDAHQRNQDAIPSIIFEPRWPRGAKSNGFVRLCFTVMSDGTPSNVEVVDSGPSRVFVKAAKRAVYRWKFKPAYIDNVAIEQSNMCYTMEFKLEE